MSMRYLRMPGEGLRFPEIEDSFEFKCRNWGTEQQVLLIAESPLLP